MTNDALGVLIIVAMIMIVVLSWFMHAMNKYIIQLTDTYFSISERLSSLVECFNDIWALNCKIVPSESVEPDEESD